MDNILKYFSEFHVCLFIRLSVMSSPKKSLLSFIQQKFHNDFSLSSMLSSFAAPGERKYMRSGYFLQGLWKLLSDGTKFKFFWTMVRIVNFEFNVNLSVDTE